MKINKKICILLLSLAILSSTFSFNVNAKERSLIKNDFSKFFIDLNALEEGFPSFIDSGTLLYVGGLGNENYSKIQDAIDNSSEGDTIFVYSGTYQENLKIEKRIKITGENRDQVIIDGTSKTDTIFIMAEGVVITNLTVKNSGNFDAGIKLNSNYNLIEYCNIIGCWDGIEFNSGNNNQITHCEIANNNWSGIYSFESNYNIIDRCHIHSNLDGVLMIGSNSNMIKNSRLDSNIQEGIELERFSNRNIFHHNKIKSNGGNGFFIYWGSDDTYISFCEVTENDIGILIGSIFLGGGNGTTILANNITNNVDSGIYFLGEGSLFRDTHIHFNNICSNGIGISAKTAMNCFIYAQNNWWGSKRGPNIFGLGSGDRISWTRLHSRVSFFPWLKSPELNQLDEYLQLSAIYKINNLQANEANSDPTIVPTYTMSNNTLYVGGLGNENYSKIQDAIDNSSEGDTIFVYSGTYQENLKIEKRIKITGENRDQVIIDGTSKTDTIFIMAEGVVITNLTVKNSGNFDAGIKLNSNYNLIEYCNIIGCWDGIEFNSGNNNQITHCEIANNQNEGMCLLFSCYNKISMCKISGNLESIWLDSSNYNIIHNCIMEENQEEGIQIKDSSYNKFISCVISSNIIGYGVYIQHDSDGNMLDKCVISENGVGIFLSGGSSFGPNGTIITFCNITDNRGTGIFFLGNGSSMNETHVHFNNICRNKKAIISSSANDCFVHAQNNWWGSKRGPSIFGLISGNRIGWNPFNGWIYVYPWFKSPIRHN